jgi:signal transduction histidine kinase
VRRRLVASNLVLISLVLVLLEVPLGLVYARHEHDALNAALQRDASSLGTLSEEIIEHPGVHDVSALAQRFTTGVGGEVVIVDKTGTQVTSNRPTKTDQAFQAALLAARAGRSGSGERGGLSYATATVGASGNSHGAVLVARSDESVDRRVHQFWLLLVVIGAGVLGVSMLVSHQLARWVVGPLKELDDTAAELGRGHLQVRAQTESGPPEVVALAVTFNEMADRVDALVRSQRRFVADASHQLRTPLTALRLRLENLDSVDTAAVASAREAALLETSRLSRLVDGLLALARAEGHRPQREPVDVTAVVHERHEAWAALATERGVDLQLEPTAGSRVSALLVPGHLDQILDNLIDNALDATAAGGAVRLSAETVGSTVEIHVSDEGRGMSVDDRRRAFDAFWQGSPDHSGASTGLGLAIVDQLVRASSGVIALDSSPSGGVDAVLCFPRADLPALAL